ncbi:MAG: alpha-1,2-fucosyltransferase [Chloroflexi bacterium]|nr:alpha-1,2-fucosyltransferase [Chloroflexota bacterium]
MIIVRLAGGLGNQMFQYAAARQMAHRLQTTLKLDISYYDSQQLRSYSLSPFAIQETFAAAAELTQIRGKSKNKLVKLFFRVRQNFKLFYRWTILHESHVMPVNRRLWTETGDTYLDGYWQSEQYFQNIEPLIRREFTLKSTPDPYSQEIAAYIADTQAVSIHIRRGDYVSDAHTNRQHGTCGLEYYHACVAHISQKVERPSFFIFSDDPVWAKENLRLPHPVIVVSREDGRLQDATELWLMSLCQHHIIANSSFSWWGAWLNPDPQKQVYAPQKWYRNPHRDNADIIPETWIKI